MIKREGGDGGGWTVLRTLLYLTPSLIRGKLADVMSAYPRGPIDGPGS